MRWASAQTPDDQQRTFFQGRRLASPHFLYWICKMLLMNGGLGLRTFCVRAFSSAFHLLHFSWFAFLVVSQGQPPDVPNTFLGVSPPVRSGCYGGAANPMQHDSSWTSCSLSASSSNLQALRELDSQHSFLRSLNGDYRLLLAPDARGFASSSEEVGPRPAAPAPPQERTHLLPFTCRAQYFAVR